MVKREHGQVRMYSGDSLIMSPTDDATHSPPQTQPAELSYPVLSALSSTPSSKQEREAAEVFSGEGGGKSHRQGGMSRQVLGAHE